MRFSDILGNEQAVEQVRNMIDADRLPHALLLHGEAGIPKLALARAAAQYLHCTNREGGDSCGHCASCRQHQSFNHTDTFFSFPYVNKSKDSKKPSVCDDFMAEWKDFLTASDVEDYERWLNILKSDNSQPSIMTAESTQIMHKMSMTAYTSRYKVLIMWLPEKMHPQCANKLLKLIEEPYDDCKFILVSDNIKGILGTILSRTQRIEMRLPSVQVIADHLVRRYSIDPQDAMAIAAPAGGNVNTAEHLMEANNELVEFHSQFVELMRAAYVYDTGRLKLWSDTIVDFKREKAQRFLRYAARQVRENFIYNLHMPQLNYLTMQEQQFSSRFAPFINEANVQAMHDELSRAERDIRGNANGRIVLFDLALRMGNLIRSQAKR